MKTNMMAGILTLTAGLASQVALPTVALAKSTQSEPSFAKAFNLKSNLVRTKLENGTYSVGNINVYIDQTRYTPADANQLHAEMTGFVNFISDTGNDYIHITGDYGTVLFDLTHKGETKTYQIYGCSSTLTDCVGSQFKITFKGPQAIFYIAFKSAVQFEVWNAVEQKWEETFSVDLNKQR